jgi:hypothetical protein
MERRGEIMTKSDDWKDACYEQDEADRRAAEREMDRAEDLADRRKDAVQDWRGVHADWKS